MTEKFRSRGVLIRLLLAFTASAIYGIVSAPFVLHFIDGFSIISVLFLFAGVLVYWWKDGFFTFFSWKREDGPLTGYRTKAREERKNTENPAFYAGVLLFVISVVMNILYYIMS